MFFVRNRKISGVLRSSMMIGGIVAVVTIVNALSNGVFLQPGNIMNVLRQIAFNDILAVGMTFVIVTAGIDLAVGSIVALTGVCMALFATNVHLPAPLLVVATLMIGAAMGAAAGWVNAMPVARLGLPPFITTLAMMQAAKGFAFIASHGQPVPVDNQAFGAVGDGYVLPQLVGWMHLPGIPLSVIWMTIVTAVGTVVLGRTRFGRYVLAVGGNEEAARLAGINVGKIKTAVYMLSGCCAAIVGFLMMARFNSGSPQTGTGMELQAIAAVVVGGTSLMGGRGSIKGTFFGALVIGVLYNAMNLLSIESYTQQVVLGVVILLAVIFDELRKRYLVAK